MIWLFPAQKRHIPAKRGLSLALRSLHLIGIAGLSGAFIFALPSDQWQPYLWITLISGALMVIKEIYTDGIWLLQLRGQVIIGKILTIGVVWLYFQASGLWVYMFSIVCSAIIAHGPGKLRYYSVWHRKVYTADIRQGKPLGIIKNSGEGS